MGFSLFFVSANAQVFYLYDDFDNDATRFNHFFNRWGGNWGVLNAVPAHPYLCCFYPHAHSTDTRTGKGRCLQIRYDRDSTVGWGGGVWSSLKLHIDSLDRTVDFTDVYGLLNTASVGKARLDSISFWAKSDQGYIIELELRDYRNSGDHQAQQPFSLPGDTAWHRYSAAFDDFVNWGKLDSTRVKKLSLAFKRGLNNMVDTGTIWIDDIGFIDADRKLPDISSDTSFLSYISALSFRYFLESVDSKGLALDRSTFSDLVSVAAIGFQLGALCIADKNRWLPPGEAEKLAENILEELWGAPHGSVQDNQNQPFGYGTCEGYWYHFLQAGSKKRKKPDDPSLGAPELSLYDTGILMAGVITAREYFSHNQSLVGLADSLYYQVNWNFLLNKDTSGVHYGRLHLGWTPENGIIPYAMDYYTEEDILIHLLSLASPTYPAPISTFEKVKREIGTYKGISHIQTAPGALFTYFFAQLWCKFPEDSVDDHPDGGMNPWLNTQKAIATNKAFCEARYNTFSWWDSSMFGLTACEGPDSSYCIDPNRPNYHAYGALPALDHVDENGTFAPYGAGSSVLHQPAMAIAALRTFDSIPKLFHPLFGFYDAFHLDPDAYPDTCLQIGYNGVWMNDAIFGIDDGPMLIMIDNYLSEKVMNSSSCRTFFTGNKYVQKALMMMYGDSSVSIDQREVLHVHKIKIYPNPFSETIKIKYEISKPSSIHACVYDAYGRQLKSLDRGIKSVGTHYTSWDGTDEQGTPLSNGIYFLSFTADHKKGMYPVLFVRRQ